MATQPWANGRGVTRELACGPGADWAWRLSMADSTGPAEFSRLIGIERLLFLVCGESLRLCFDDGEVVALERPAAWARFSGERALQGVPDQAGTSQLNLMWRPDQMAADWAVVHGPATDVIDPTAATVWLWHVVEGHLDIDDQRVNAGITAIADFAAAEPGPRIAVAGTTIALTLTSIGDR